MSTTIDLSAVTFALGDRSCPGVELAAVLGLCLPDSGSGDDLGREQATFERELPHLLAKQVGHINPPRYALIIGDKVDSLWETEIDAVRAGHRLFGMSRFMVAKIEPRK